MISGRKCRHLNRSEDAIGFKPKKIQLSDDTLSSYFCDGTKLSLAQCQETLDSVAMATPPLLDDSKVGYLNVKKWKMQQNMNRLREIAKPD
jgi:hypothetical protein